MAFDVLTWWGASTKVLYWACLQMHGVGPLGSIGVVYPRASARRASNLYVLYVALALEDGPVPWSMASQSRDISWKEPEVRLDQERYGN